MSPKLRLTPPPGAAITTIRHTVAFYETDAMGIVHHSNYVRYLEHARVAFLSEHDQPYHSYVAQGFHVPVTHVDVHYFRPSRFADQLVIQCWAAWSRHASFGFAYRLELEGVLIATALTDHAVTTAAGQPVRMPEPMRERMASWTGRRT